MVVSSLLAAFGIISGQGALNLPMLRYTGKTGQYYDCDFFRKEIANMPPLMPYTGYRLDDGSVAITDGRTITAIFDITYAPMRILMAKSQIADLILHNGPFKVYIFEELPTILQAEMADQIRIHYPKYRRFRGFQIRFEAGLNTSVKIPGAATVSLAQDLGTTPTPEEALRITEQKKYCLLKVEDRPNIVVNGDPDVKIFSETLGDYEKRNASERRIFEAFDKWLDKEHAEWDFKIFLKFEQLGKLGLKSDVFRAKEFGELARTSPQMYSELYSKFEQTLYDNGARNSDEVRTMMSRIRMANSSNFTVLFFLQGGQQGSFTYPD